jgi:hypothetical protein
MEYSAKNHTLAQQYMDLEELSMPNHAQAATEQAKVSVEDVLLAREEDLYESLKANNNSTIRPIYADPQEGEDGAPLFVSSNGPRLPPLVLWTLTLPATLSSPFRYRFIPLTGSRPTVF